MRAVCKSVLGEDIPSSERYLGEVDQTSYSPLVVGGEYLVYALLFIFDRVDYLVRVPGQPPFWVPSSLFDLVDAQIPAGWELCIARSRTDYRALFDAFGVGFIVGYPLLVNDYRHYVGIAERDPGEVQRFMEIELAQENEQI